MDDSKVLKKNPEISEKEEEVINAVLEHYDFKILFYEKVRSVYKVKTSEGNICLKKLKHGRNKAENGDFLVNSLFSSGFYNTPKYIKTKANNLFVKQRGLYFYVTEWINGVECNLDKLEEALACSKLLAKFHLATENIDTKKLKIKSNLKNWPEIYKKKLYDLSKYENTIHNKKIKTSFDIYYKDSINKFINKGMLALRILNDSEYYRLSKSSKGKTICHDSFYYQNIIKKNNEYYIIDLDSIIIDLQINDLGKFIRRLMTKKSYRWDFSKALKIIQEYDSVSKLTKPQLEVMLALIIFPHKFWKLGRKRYVKHKNWSEHKYTRKLKKALEDINLQEKFIEDYIRYISSSIN